jgi:hypothetical protein
LRDVAAKKKPMTTDNQADVYIMHFVAHLTEYIDLKSLNNKLWMWIPFEFSLSGYTHYDQYLVLWVCEKRLCHTSLHYRLFLVCAFHI